MSGGYATRALVTVGGGSEPDCVPIEIEASERADGAATDACRVAIEALAEQARALIVAGEFEAARAVVDAVERITRSTRTHHDASERGIVADQAGIRSRQ